MVATDYSDCEGKDTLRWPGVSRSIILVHRRLVGLIPGQGTHLVTGAIPSRGLYGGHQLIFLT